MHVTTEIVFSVGQEKKSTGLLSKSELREVFHVDETNKDCMERMAREVQSYLFTTHTVMQYLRDNQKEMLKQLSTPQFIYQPVAGYGKERSIADPRYRGAIERLQGGGDGLAEDGELDAGPPE